MMACTVAGSNWLRATTRASWVCGRQSTTSTASTCERQWADSTSSGTSNTRQRCPAASVTAAFRPVSCPTNGWMMASSRFLAAGSENASVRIWSRSNAPSGVIMVSPKALRIRGMARPPGAVTARAMASASMTAAPKSARKPATVLLPLPMPPVRPRRKAHAIAYKPTVLKMACGPKIMAVSPAPARKGPNGM